MEDNNLENSINLRFLSKIVFIAIVLVAIIVAFYPKNSLIGIHDFTGRDNPGDLFQEIKILKTKNADLNEEVKSLEKSLAELTDRDKALSSIEDEIIKYMKLNGETSVYGTGVLITISDHISTQWITDLVNEFFSYGAEAISINDIRLTNKTIGFDMLPKGQIFLNGSILSAPFSIKIIGDASNIINFINSPGNIISRLNLAYPNTKIVIDRKDILQMK